jgi:SAM-dependent methyltransferase
MAGSGVGAEFASALAGPDYARVEEVLDPAVDFRALTPNRTWRAVGAEQVIERVLRDWFDDATDVEKVTDMEVTPVSDRLRIGYRMHGRDGDGPFVFEQQGYFEERDGRITWLRLVCSGFRRPEPNGDAIAAWNGPLFERFVRFREVVTTGLAAHGEVALALDPPLPGERVLDIGCGFGDTTQAIAELVGPDGIAVGVDAAERFVEAARAEAAGIPNARFLCADVEAELPEQGFDLAFSRLGTMFFANPVAALRNVRAALVPGGRLCMVVWRAKRDNDWLHRAETVVAEIVDRNEDSDEPTCGPGPFSMAGADSTSDILLAAGFEQVTLRRCDIPIRIGADVDDAVAYACALGPAGELIRLAGPAAEPLLPRIDAALRDALAEFDGPDGVVAPASTWIVSARAPR